MRQTMMPEGRTYRHLDYRLDRWHRRWEPIMPSHIIEHRRLYQSRSKYYSHRRGKCGRVSRRVLARVSSGMQSYRVSRIAIYLLH